MRRRGSAWIVVWAAAIVGSGCFVDRSGAFGSTRDAGEPPNDGGDPRLDGAPDDDAARPDGGTPPCSHRGRSRLAARLGPSELRAGDTSGARVEDPGVVALPVQGYVRGSTLWTGYDGALLDDAAATPSDLDGATPERSSLHDLDHGFYDADDLGVGGDGLSVSVRGEIYLATGTNTFELFGDDHMVLELDVGGTTRRGRAAWPTREELTVEIPSDGWYPLRAAFEDTVGYAAIEVDLRRPGETGFSPIEPSELRVHLGDEPGEYGLGFDLENPDTTPDGQRIDTSATDRDYTAVEPRGFGIFDRSHWTVRWFGMHRFDTARESLVAEVEKRFHLWVDGVYLGDGDGDGTYDAGFAPGWHEVVFQVSQDGGNDGYARLQYGGAAFEPEAMRAHGRAGGAPFGAGARVDQTLDSGDDVTETLTLDAPPVEPGFVELSAIVETPAPAEVRVQWTDPDGGTGDRALADDARRVPGTTRWVFRALAAITDPGGGWDLVVVNEAEEQARVERLGVLSHVGGVRDPYPTSGEWTSQPLDLGEDRQVDRVALDAALPAGSRVRVEVRAADDAMALADAAFVEADADGRVGGALTGRVAQVRLTLEGDGTVTPRVWGVRVFGRPCLSCAEERCGPWATDGLQVLYALDETDGEVVADTAGVAPALDLSIARPDRVRWSGGALVFEAPTIAEGAEDATRVVEACQASGEVTVEAWIAPATEDPVENRPGRIVTLSEDTGAQAFVLGQEDALALTGRVHAMGGSFVETSTPEDAVAVGAISHVVFTRAADGTTAVYVDGARAATGAASGDLSVWDAAYRLALGDERDGERGWLGALHLVAIYDRALSAGEVERHFEVGPDGGR